jgi:predicted small secreted protein
MVRKILLILCLIAASLFAGCQTVQGIGGDVQWLGEAGANLLD